MGQQFLRDFHIKVYPFNFSKLPVVCKLMLTLKHFFLIRLAKACCSNANEVLPTEGQIFTAVVFIFCLHLHANQIQSP